MMKNGDAEESSSVNADSSADSESDLTSVTETQCEISEDLLNLDSTASSATDNNSSNESQKLNQDEENKRKLPNMASMYWYNDKCFSRYWQHYHKVMNWYKKHLHVYKSMRGQYDSHQGFQRSGNTSMTRSQTKRRRGYQKHKFKSDSFSKRKTIVQSYGEKTDEPMSGTECPDVVMECPKVMNNLNVAENTASETDEYEMAITDEMLEFFAQSQQHRKERDAKNKNENGEKSDEIVYIEDIHKPMRTVNPPKERPGVRRTAEMKLLYGKGAAMIHGMETALKMTYDRNIDVKQPKVWPNIPLRIVFAD